MKYILIIFLFILLYACSKDDAPLTPSGIWVEQSLRLDTFDFSKTFGTVDNKETVFLRTNPIFYTNMYSYYFKSDSLFLRNFLSSSNVFGTYKFQMNANQQTFNVARFYNRNSLPATITFEKIK